MAERLNKRTAPYITAAENVSGIMLDVIIALLPAVAWAVYMFGLGSLQVIAVSVIASVASDAVMGFIVRRKFSVGDLSAVVSGIVLALTLPHDVPLLLPAAGGAFAMIVIKGLFGGIGKNIFNPAIAARLFIGIAWQEELATETYREGISILETVNGGELSPVPLVDMFIGNRGGAMGEISILLLVAGACYLFLRKTVSFYGTLGFFGGAAAVCVLLCTHYDPFRWTLSHFFAGGFMLCAVFAVNDMCTTPLTSVGKLICGAVGGALAILFRHYLSFGEGVGLAVLAADLLVRPIDRLLIPRPFGSKMRTVPVAEKEAESVDAEEKQ